MAQTSILIVEDEEGPRESLEAFLLDLDFQVETAIDVQTAIEHIRQGSFDIIITDKNMPNSHGHTDAAGIQVLKFAAENSPETQVIVTTGYASLENAIQAMKMGAFDYLIKPFSLDRLEQIIKRILTYKAFINSPQTIHSYRSIHNEILAVLELTRLTEEERHKLLRELENKIDDFFKGLKRLEAIIIDQRDSMAQIAMHAGILNEQISQDDNPELSEHLLKISQIADRRI